MIEVLRPGLFTTVQDLGRDGFTHIGVSPAGACDKVALRIGNLLVGNDEGAAALELTLAGGAFRFEAAADAAVTGGDFGATVEDKRVPPWSSIRIHAGQTLQFGQANSGARAYLCVAGGIAVPSVLGSMSTHVSGRLGGIDGRMLRAGDRLHIGTPLATVPERSVPREFAPLLRRRSELRVTPGAQVRFFDGDAVYRFAESRFRVRSDSNRQGLRLSGPGVPYPGEMQSEGVAPGAIQVLPDGQLIVLFVDSQTTGGYPVIACVISADLPHVAQLRPADETCFVPVSIAQALSALREQERLMTALRQHFAVY